MREVRLRLGDYPGKNRACVACAISSDYMPCMDNYGRYFEAIAKVRMDEEYLLSEEYFEYCKNYEASRTRLYEAYEKQ